MEDWKQRVIEERTELLNKTIKLEDYINDNPLYKELSVVDQFLLCKQRDEMAMYGATLDARIARFLVNVE